MIGLSEDDIAAFLTITKKDLGSDSLRATPSLFHFAKIRNESGP